MSIINDDSSINKNILQMYSIKNDKKINIQKICYIFFFNFISYNFSNNFFSFIFRFWLFSI